ncbi:4407_t:CDS:2, partial [Paraglomus occultum]
MTKESPVKNTAPPTYKFKVNKEYSNHKPRMLIPPRRKAIHNFYEFQKKCLELSADYYQGIANLMRETDVTLFISPLNQGDPLQIINETGMVISGMLNPPSTTYGSGPGAVKHNKENNGENVQELESGPNKPTQRNKRAPRQLWGEEEVARLKASFTKYQGDWEAIIKEFEPDRT